jgi:hypothetical protein
MSDPRTAETELERPEVTATGLLVARTERLAPLYDAAIWTFTWGFRIGAVLLALGVMMALIKSEPLGREADPFGEVIGQVRAGNASGIIDLAILWFMLTPMATVIVVVVKFWQLGDRRYALLSLIVLTILAVSIALALNR